jgi:hypothetical protein
MVQAVVQAVVQEQQAPVQNLMRGFEAPREWKFPLDVTLVENSSILVTPVIHLRW